jgi:aerobic carbon-monoxide dehydrogenase medium subunit
MRFIGEYFRASSPEDALVLMKTGIGRGCFLAGGTDLLLSVDPDLDFVVDITGAGLSEIVESPEGDIFIGAATSLRELETNPLLKTFASGIVSKAAARCGNRPVRTTATVGGNLCNALPSADMAPVLLALDAVAYVTDGDEDESLMLHDFFVAPRKTILDGRLLVGLALPSANSSCLAVSEKLTRTAEDISLAQVAAALHIKDGVIERARIALGAVAPVPMLAEEAEQVLAGVSLDDAPEAIEEAAQLAGLVCEPINDMRASADYRRAMIRTMTARALRSAAGLEGGAA